MQKSTTSAKILPISDIQKLASQKNIVLTGGCFDIFHFGHLTHLRKAKEKGDVLVVLLESDEFIQQHKNRQPTHTQQQRAEILAALVHVDYVILLPLFTSYEDYWKVIQQIHPAIIAVSANDEKKEVKEKQAAAIGARLEVVNDIIPELSSSKILTL